MDPVELFQMSCDRDIEELMQLADLHGGVSFLQGVIELRKRELTRVEPFRARVPLGMYVRVDLAKEALELYKTRTPAQPENVGQVSETFA